MPERRMFISFNHVPETRSGNSTEFGFGHMSVEVDFPIRNLSDLNKAVSKGLAENGVTGKHIAVLSWRFFEE